jgi:broad specificity phosphatase PhoE
VILATRLEVMQLFLIRHGQSTNNALADWTQRVEDPWLTASGVRQAQRVGHHLVAGLHLQPTERSVPKPVLDRLYCSAILPALQSANARSATPGAIAAN